MVQYFGNRRSVQKSAQNEGSNVLKIFSFNVCDRYITTWYTSVRYHLKLGIMIVNKYHYYIIQVSDHKLTGTDHHIRRDPRRYRHLGSSYCNNDKFIIYPSIVIEKLWNKYFGPTIHPLFTKKNKLLKELLVIFVKPWRPWVKHHF